MKLTAAEKETVILFSEADETELLLVEQWESYQHQQDHIAQPHMARLRELKNDYILSTELHEIEIKD